MISIRNITVQFGGIKAIDELTADLAPAVCGLIGPNGAGKTTLINLLSGLYKPRSGSVHVDGKDLLDMAPVQRVRWGLRRSFQTEQVVEDLNVWDNVLAVFEQTPHQGLNADQEVEDVLHYTGLTRVATRMGHQINLFERRMVELAKALVGKPKLLLLDEPGAGLNENEAVKLREAILGIRQFRNAQVLLIDHDVELITDTCEQTLVLDFGRRIALGPTREVLASQEVRKAYLGT